MIKKCTMVQTMNGKTYYEKQDIRLRTDNRGVQVISNDYMILIPWSNVAEVWYSLKEG